MADRSQKKEDALHKLPLRITDTTLRDAHQSLWATRMRTSDIMEIIDTIDKAGYYSLEMWGGATFDVCMRFLRENPWERLREVKKRATKTPLQMLLRGQNAVGYRNYSDDVIDKFVALACKNGIDIFRIFDALNDTRNLEAAIKAVKKHGGHAQGTLAYTTSPVHTVEKYVEYAKEQVQLGVDSLCIKDMAGILSPIMAEKLVSALIKEVDVPIQLHAHATSGMATPTYVEGVRAGAGAIDCSISSMAGFTSQPPVETLASIFNETNYATNLDFDALADIAAFFSKLKHKRAHKSTAMDSIIDPGILVHQIPGGMISNFRSQLDMQGALDKLDDALKEVTAVRKDLGYPPLVTPTSQIVGTQAVMNVLSGERYSMVPNEVKEYVRGKYGRSPAPIDPEFIKKILGDEKPIDHRPADDIKPMLPTIANDLEAGLIKEDEDVLSYAMFPEVAIEYFKWRNLPEEERDPIPADLEMEADKSTEEVKITDLAMKQGNGKADTDQMVHTNDYTGIAHVIAQTAGLNLDELSIRKGDFSIDIRANGAAPRPSAQPQPAAAPSPVEPAQSSPAPQETAPQAPAASAGDASAYDNTVTAPLVGTFYAASEPGQPPFVKVGDSVKAGDTVCIVEAMKLFNEIKATKDGIVGAIFYKDGDKVSKGDVLIGLK
ncbi:acetyl-CoA carboxylase biotin carboxyl carrier protein [Spirochaeta isovalerica]|uniref:Oxaloacetate decarboxylase alpha subunit n=1 Tax=Spirochaeta isovalerica TaxID=150 RepID=A0A841RDZ1_9SPIO|nr:acetyl-CoA carboxylase biotin carboxyl carrier protein [Spirochaeta isovalerica]MBB6481437.1 oxaloacetate decarboxylase alpha subunit [Spirochaeta isovalerica]